MSRLNFSQKFSDKTLIFFLKFIKKHNLDPGFTLGNPNLTPRNMLLYNPNSEAFMKVFVGKCQIKGRRLEKMIEKNPEYTRYISFNSNLTREMILKYSHLTWDYKYIARMGLLSIEDFAHFFPEVPIKEYLYHSKYLTEQLLEMNPPGNHLTQINANSLVSIDFILKYQTLLWFHLGEREDLTYQVYFDRCMENRFLLSRIMLRIKSREEFFHVFPIFGLGYGNINLYRNKFMDFEDIIYFHNEYSIELEAFSQSQNLPFKFVLDNFNEDNGECYFKLNQNKFTLERKKAKLSFAKEAKIKKLLEISF